MQKKDAKTPAVDMLLYEKQAHRRGFCLVTGIDEAGRGPLAGPVVAGAVILPRWVRLPGLTDSKMLSAAQREKFDKKIRATASAFGIGVVDNTEIDRINILKASFRAMMLAVEQMGTKPDFLLIDGPYKLPLEIEQVGIPRGDALSLSIAAASVLAKVHRDRIMCEYHERYPQYGFDSNKGYGTARHREAIRRHGPCPLHRLSFGCVTGRLEREYDGDEPDRQGQERRG
ncbi:MAG: ribonuclease HII [Syntrophobacteraceae bacterium]